MTSSPLLFISTFTPNLKPVSSSSSFLPTFTTKTATVQHHVASTKMIAGLFNFSLFRRHDETVSLPQHAPGTQKDRQSSMEKAREQYKWDLKAVPGASLMEGVPEIPALGWIEKIIPILLRVQINATINSTDESAAESESSITKVFYGAAGAILTKVVTGSFTPNDITEAITKVQDFAKPTKKPYKAKTIEEHKELFENIRLDVVAKNNQFLEDDMFGRYRVAGPNPMRITKCDKDTLKKLFSEFNDSTLNGIVGFENDSLIAMLNADRLYYVSYPEFEGIPTGHLYDSGTKQPFPNQKESFVYSPSCLLGVPKNPTKRQTVLPLAIRAGPSSSRDYQLLSANPKDTGCFTWQAAKLTVQVADAISHETIYHLARTHFLSGLFVCATYRQLPEQHPLYQLLKCHFYGTAFINGLALTTLIAPGGQIDEITAPDIYTTQSVSANGINGENSKFNEWFPDVELKNRGVMNKEALPFPYRDDALLVWSALLDWVSIYIKSFYKSDLDVQQDTELKNWCEELTSSDRGNLHGFGDNDSGKISTVDYLIRAVSLVIFSATAQHAALNFPQASLMQFAPAMPLAGYGEAPKQKRNAQFNSLDDVCKEMMPTLDASASQLATAETIGVLQYGTLGQYERDEIDFISEDVMSGLEQFQSRLGVIGGDIQKRNELEHDVGLPIYKCLVPQNIPQSVNI